MTARGLLIVLSDPAQGADEDEFNRWYSAVHAPEMVERGAAVSFRRLHASGVPLAPGIPELPSYAAVYEIEADTVEDVEAIQQRLDETKHLKRGMSSTLDLSSVRAAFYLPVG
ncbi:hypothetical protein [Sporichthya sp.]|uniref:hypothetical protein n=1 Tax=Sporichthya sp. TaxID=65475 RepID=UPI0017D15DA9|nr:hypothetical protein [Sporichthya sp.]MBA3743322.1 hypothetical protein [Sporichthya sp.]